jgi:hypothetical protein
LPNTFSDLKFVTKSYILDVTAPIKMGVPVGQSNIANKFQPHMKRGRPIDSKDKNP